MQCLVMIHLQRGNARIEVLLQEPIHVIDDQALEPSVLPAARCQDRPPNHGTHPALARPVHQLHTEE